MSKSYESPDTLLIICCSCDSYHGRLVAVAAQGLVETQGATKIDLNDVPSPAKLKEMLVSWTVCIGVEGCSRRCLKQQLDILGVRSEFHLNLDELAIEERAGCDILPEDLELAKDAIIAASARVGHLFPVFPEGCCC